MRIPLTAVLWLIATGLLAAANQRLYLKDGSYHLVREYKVVAADRVRYYSVERGDWEEIPLELVDLKRTEQELQQVEDTTKADVKAQEEEEKAERDARKQLELIPQETGVYLIDANEKIRTIKMAETKVVVNKKRTILKWMTPLPVVSDKSTVELDGEHSSNMVLQDRPEFYIRLHDEERFGIIRLTPKKGVRIVENISIIPVSKEVIEQQEQIECFRQQLGDMLYKIWPIKALPPGEYAVVEYTDGKVNIQVWDFAWAPQPR